MAGINDLIGTNTGTMIGAGLGVASDVYKWLLGNAQAKDAKNMHPYDPGYQMNNEVIDNARVLGDQYSDYQLPGQQQYLDQIKQSGNTAFVNAKQGATSSADLLNAANVGNQVQQSQLQRLSAETASGKQSMLTQYLAAKAAAGAEYENKNAYDRERYGQQMQLKNQLANNGTANEFGAADQAGKLIAAIFASKGGVTQPGNNGNVTLGNAIFGGDE